MIDAEAAHALLLEEQPSGSSVETFLPEHNRGYRLLCKMGWAGQGVGLGRRGGGIAVPVRLTEQYGSLGLGKATEYNEKAEAATETRRAMTSELVRLRWMESRTRGGGGTKQGTRCGTIRMLPLLRNLRQTYTKIMNSRPPSSYDHHHRKRWEMRRSRRQGMGRQQPRQGQAEEGGDPAMLAVRRRPLPPRRPVPAAYWSR